MILINRYVSFLCLLDIFGSQIFKIKLELMLYIFVLVNDYIMQQHKFNNIRFWINTDKVEATLPIK